MKAAELVVRPLLEVPREMWHHNLISSLMAETHQVMEETVSRLRVDGPVGRADGKSRIIHLHPDASGRERWSMACTDQCVHLSWRELT